MQWLQDVFIPYLDKWESSVKARPETSFSKSDKDRMLLSAETRLGLRMTGIVACDSITVAIQKIKIKKFSTLLCWPGEDDILPSRSERKKTVTSQRAPLPRPFGELLRVPEATRGHE